MSEVKTVNHWGKWVSSDTPVTGVLSIHDIAWEWMDDEICLDCLQAEKDIRKQYRGERREKELESLECDSSHDKIIGDWKKDRHAKFYPNPKGEFAAIVREDVVQVVYSKFTARGALCSPCYPGQVDLDTPGDFLGYTLPKELLCEDDDDETEYPACPMCGTVNSPMGSLGSKTWYRCQSCGMEYSA